MGYPRADDGNATLQLLGSFELWRGAQRVRLAPAAQRLLAFLALRHGMTARGYVAGVLWIDYSQDAANANLRTALWRLRKLRSPVVETSATHLSLASRVAVDLREAAEVARRASEDGSDLLPSEIEGILLAGDVLPDWYEDWVVMERERFRQLRLHALETLCYALARKRRYGKAIEVGLAAVAEEPLRESAHRAVMRVHLAEGNRNEALRQYEWCRRGLVPLGLEPTAETQRLRERCAIGDGAVTIPCQHCAGMIPGSEWGASSERAGVMVVRIWVEGAHDSLRARLTHTLDLDGAEQTTQTAASVEEILKVVREWLHVFAEAGRD